MLPIGGSTAAEALRLYIEAAPAKFRRAAGFPDRLPLRSYRDPPGLWRRTVALPVQYRFTSATKTTDRHAFEAQVCALPSPEWLAHWYRRVRAEWWRRYAVHAFLRDLVEGRIAAYGSTISGIARGAEHRGADMHGTPATFFESDMDLAVEAGQLFGRNDNRIPLVRDLRFYRADDIPAEVTRAAEAASVRARHAVASRARHAQMRHAVAAE